MTNELRYVISKYRCDSELEAHVDIMWADFIAPTLGGTGGCLLAELANRTVLRDSSALTKVGVSIAGALLGTVVGGMTRTRQESQQDEVRSIIEKVVGRTRALELEKQMKLFGLRMDAPQVVFFAVADDAFKQCDPHNNPGDARAVVEFISLQVAAKAIVEAYQRRRLPAMSATLIREDPRIVNWRPALEM